MRRITIGSLSLMALAVLGLSGCYGLAHHGHYYDDCYGYDGSNGSNGSGYSTAQLTRYHELSSRLSPELQHARAQGYGRAQEQQLSERRAIISTDPGYAVASDVGYDQGYAQGYERGSVSGSARRPYPAPPSMGSLSGMGGTIRACISAQDARGAWGPDEPVRVSIIDGWALRQIVGRSQGDGVDELYVLINWGRGGRTVLPLEQRTGLSTAASVLQDTAGNSWRISRTWQRCMR